MDPFADPFTPSNALAMVAEKESFTIPELSDSEYLEEVLQLPVGKTEAQADQELVARANAAGFAATLPSVASQRHPTSSCSVSSFGIQQDRTCSNASNVSASTALTSHSSVPGSPLTPFDTGSAGRRGSHTTSLTFAHYERYISSLDPGSIQKLPPRIPYLARDSSAQSLTSVGSKKSSFASIRNCLHWKRRTIQPVENKIPCISCRKFFGAESGALRKLQCGHTHCVDCVRDLVNQAVQHESQMPPRCCSKPLAAPLVRTVLNQEAQETFLLAVLKLITPVEERLFCPDAACGHFIPPPDAHDPNHPFDLTCFKCHGRVCIICKGAAHPIGEDCPQDWELAVLKKKQQDEGNWKRCYECRALVEPTEESPYMTCRCKARFCSMCVGIWDPSTGCPNLCNFEEELQRRRQSKEANSCANEQRLRANSAIQQLGQEQQAELRRFLDYRSQGKDALQTRHLMQEAAIEEKYECQEDRLHERHERAWTAQEDRHVVAEMELLEILEQEELNIHLRLKHMEAYCHGLGRNPNSSAPVRVVTEQDLRQLGQQYYLRDSMGRMRETKIHCMRVRQSAQMAELRTKQTEELSLFLDKRQEGLDRLETRCVQEEAQFNRVFEGRQSRLQSRWVLAIEVLCKELEDQNPGETYQRIATPRWPDEKTL